MKTSVVESGICSGLRCGTFVKAGDGIQDWTDRDNPRRYCARCWSKLWPNIPSDEPASQEKKPGAQA